MIRYCVLIFVDLICDYFEEVSIVFLEEKIENIMNRLVVNKSIFLLEVCKKICVEDLWMLFKYMGLVVIVFFGILFGLFLVLDFFLFLR